MHKKISFLLLMLMVNIAFSDEPIKLKIGVSGIVEIPLNHSGNKSYDITYLKDDMDARLINNLVSGSLDFLVVPYAQALQVFWYGKTYGIAGKSSPAYEFLLSKQALPAKDKLKGKSVALIPNAGSALILTKFLGHKNVKYIPVNSLEILSILDNDFKKNGHEVDAVMLNSSSFKRLKNKSRFKVQKVEAGSYVVLALEQDRPILRDPEFLKLMKVSKIKFKTMEDQDNKYLTELNNSISKTAIAQSFFETIFNYRFSE